MSDIFVRIAIVVSIMFWSWLIIHVLFVVPYIRKLENSKFMESYRYDDEYEWNE